MTINIGRMLKVIFLAVTMGAIWGRCSTHPAAPVREGAIDAFVQGDYLLEKTRGIFLRA